MKNHKNTITLTLIVSSLALLLALQIVWITNSYERAYMDLQKETSSIFHNTVFSMRDSLLMRSLERIDSAHDGKHFQFNSKTDTVMFRPDGSRFKARAESQVQIYISSPEKSDSLHKIIRPLAIQVQEGKVKGGSTFVLRMGGDSLSIDSLQSNFRKNFEKAGYNAPFIIKYHRTLPPKVDFKSIRSMGFRSPESWEDSIHVSAFSATLISEWVRFDPLHSYAVVLPDVRAMVIEEISPQIFFSIFLTLLTTAAFMIMYRSIKTQQRLMELKNEFISNITHELKTPITTVGVAIEAIKNFKAIDNPTLTMEYLDIAQNELNRLSILTDKVLKTAIFENKGIDFTPEPVELDYLVEQVISSMKLVFEKQGARVTFDKQGDNFTIMGGSIHLTNLVYNLIDNALKYSLISPEIALRLMESDNNIVLSVQDNGIGIAAEYQHKVFEKFFRVPTGDVHNIKGYGLGLSYVDSVIKSHKGKIEIESAPGKGSKFIITLPKG